MQKVNIERILKKLKRSIYRRNYINAFDGNDNIDLFTTERGIKELDFKTEHIYPNWNWNKFENLKKNFLELFFKEVNYCPNCGKSPFLSTGKLNVKSFDLDHYFPKSNTTYKHLMFNFYNLIPICPFCNQKIKKDRDPLDYKGNLFHPYFGTINLENKEFKIIDKDKNLCLNFGKNKEVLGEKGYINFMNLDKIYINSKDTNLIFNFIQDKRTKMKDERNNFKDSSKSDEELKEYFFKNYYPEDENEILKYSNGKLKMDLIKDLKIKD